MKTYMARTQDFEKKWYLIDGEGKTVGRLATTIANILRGKNKPQYTPHADIGDFVIVVNADKLHFTGDKWNQKTYYRHTNHPGGIKEITAGDLLKTKPNEIIKKAVWGMLPKNTWQPKLLTRLKVYTGTEHPHAPQQPETLEV
ncbi:MAG: 50S ribosomal protein L13 [Thermodesulfobacteriota bacterium]|jgi:large subunit ribosomal protein L13